MQQFAGDETLLFYMSEEAQEGRDAFQGERRPDFAKFPGARDRGVLDIPPPWKGEDSSRDLWSRCRSRSQPCLGAQEGSALPRMPGGGSVLVLHGVRLLSRTDQGTAAISIFRSKHAARASSPV